MSATAPPPPDPAVWQAQYLRLIAFPIESQVAVEQNWWQELAGVAVESSTRKPAEREDTGVFEGVKLTLAVSLRKLQWTASPQIDPANPPDHVPTLGSFAERRDWFGRLMSRWIGRCPPISRIAFAGLLVQPIEGIREGNELLDRYLRRVDVDRESTDVLFRMNRRRRSDTGVPDLWINRLCTWSLVRFRVEVGEEALQFDERVQRVVHETDACALELDINTAPDYPQAELPHGDLGRIFDELVACGVDLAAHGDSGP